MDLLTLESAPEKIPEEDLIRLVWIISRWELTSIIDIDSGTIRDDFPEFVQSLEKTDDNKRAVEMVFWSCMVVRLREAVRNRVLDCSPENIAWILSGEALVLAQPDDIFLPHFIKQMWGYYHQFLEWKWA